MQLPNCLQAYIPSEKLSAYLLSETHAVGKAKAMFFHALGFNEANMHVLEARVTDPCPQRTGARSGPIAAWRQVRH